MCGISGIYNITAASSYVDKMVRLQSHRGPNATGSYFNPDNTIALGHNRLSIIDRSESGNQPIFSKDMRYCMVYNGEVYNYKELRNTLEPYFQFTSNSDSEVVLYAYMHWGEECLERFIGMFAFAVWDTLTQELFLARDRFGVKPLHYCKIGKGFAFASEIKALFASGLISKEPDEGVWADYFAFSKYDHSDKTFWKNIRRLGPGCFMKINDNQCITRQWYHLEAALHREVRSKEDVKDELLSLLEESVMFRFRSDVPVGICLSGGLDSSLLLSLVQRYKGKDYPVHAFSFYCNDARYDELPWVNKMLAGSSAILHPCLLSIKDTLRLARKVSDQMDEPYGGIPTLGMSRVFEEAAAEGIIVLLDGNGIDEGWGGYDYYRKATEVDINKGPVQQSSSQIDLSQMLAPSFLSKVNTTPVPFAGISPLVDLQVRDILFTKIPRSMRFADRNSMAYSLELREPFLDHRIIELGISQPANYKISENEGKVLVRELAQSLLPQELRLAPKRGVQTPQREWLKGELKPWVEGNIDKMLRGRFASWFQEKQVRTLWEEYKNGAFDNSFFVWQWINFQMLTEY